MNLHRLARRIRLPAALIVAAGLVGICPAVASASSCANWTGTSTVNPTGNGDAFAAVAMPSPCSAWAVGSYQSSGVNKTLVEHWDGTHWTFELSASPGGFNNDSYLSGVAAVRGANPWAVGFYNTSPAGQTLIETPKNGVWTQVPSQNPGGRNNNNNALYAVAATSATNAWAVGWYSNGAADLTLIERWNGSSWRRVSSPDPGAGGNVLDAVAAISAKDAWAVGQTVVSPTASRTLILRWNGRAWKRVPSPNPAGSSHRNVLLGVAAVSASSAWAVGQQLKNGTWQPLIERWNGTAWMNVRAPGPVLSVPSQLTSVTTISAGDAWAVGSYGNSSTVHTLIEHWNGRAWRRMPSPSPGNIAALFGAASSRTSLWAVGYYNSGGPAQTLAVHCC